MTFYPHPPPTTHDSQHLVTLSLIRVFSHDLTAAILVFQNNKTAAMLVFQTNPVGVIEITSWKARAYGIFTRVGEVSEIERVSSEKE